MAVDILLDIEKKADETKAVKFDYRAFLTDAADTISGTPVVTATPVDLTVSAPTVLSNIVMVLVSGGSAGKKYTVQCKLTTTGGRVEDAFVNIQVK
jgi:hypothetical protein